LSGRAAACPARALVIIERHRQRLGEESAMGTLPGEDGQLPGPETPAPAPEAPAPSPEAPAGRLEALIPGLEAPAPRLGADAGRPHTGDDRVDEALARLDELAGLPVTEHPAVFEHVNQRLAEVLGDLGTGDAGSHGR
jgi:hypothetical protein